VTAAADRPAVDDALVGALLDDRYRVTALIGRGGVATVYRATDTALGREVAIKVFRGVEGLDDPARRSSERALLASLAHPALVTLHDAAREPATGREFLVMEFVDGPNLRERLDQGGPLTAADTAAMTVELAEALHVIHSRGIVHRDVKPANVLLSPSPMPARAWRAKLADFGIARLIDDSRLTATGGLIGTPAYLAPEQVRGDGATSASDIYALGLLVLESRTGRAAFPGPALESASARLTRDPELPADLDPEWRDLLAHMLARDPAARPEALEIAIRAATLGTRGEADASAARLRAQAAAQAGTDTTSSMTEPATGPDTGPATGPAAEPATASMDATAALDAHELDDRGEAPTMLLTGATQAPARPAPEVAARDVRPVAPGSRRVPGGKRRPKWLVPVAIVAPLGLAAAFVVPIVVSAVGDGAAEPTPAPIPSVPGELGVHLEELQEAVTP
jgi:hypothetical protein